MHTKLFTYIIFTVISLASCKSYKVYEPSSGMSIVQCKQEKVAPVELHAIQARKIPVKPNKGITSPNTELRAELHPSKPIVSEPKLRKPPMAKPHFSSATATIKESTVAKLEPSEIVKWVFVGLLTAILFVLFIVFLAQASISPGLVVAIGAIVAIGVGAFMIMYFNN